MNWANHGAFMVGTPRVWNIDHCMPIRYPGADGSPPTLEEVVVRLHWTNTKAMWAEENAAKGNRLDDTLRAPIVPVEDLTAAEPVDEEEGAAHPSINIPVEGAAMLQGHTAAVVLVPKHEPDPTPHPCMHGC